ncbi:uncharacterized protein LOC141599424 [Silene latifolia]|uniref:uncharacterized protein LOC141599424 n=1 Tax=Silene latifolia TaxID=37657 RepID=UPI003D789DFA
MEGLFCIWCLQRNNVYQNMDPVTLTVIAGAGIGTAVACKYLGNRETLKSGDICIHDEADRERALERLESKPNLLHCLHPHHLQYLDAGPPFGCDACTDLGIGRRYSCRGCDFDLHQACAKSNDVLVALVENDKITSFVHEHPLTLVTGTSSYTCNHCNNETNLKYRFYCEPCNLRFDMMCTTNPTRLLSFLHPQHELELKTRKHFKKCSVCGERKGGTNTRVYRCKACKFYVHPVCAIKSQYTRHRLHGNDHILVFTAVASNESVVCMACRKYCTNWCYLCSVCKGVYFHPECLVQGTSSSSDGFGGQIVGVVGTTIVGEVVKLLFNAAIS